MKKLMFFLEDFKIGGVEKALVELVNCMSVCDYELYICVWENDFSTLEKNKLNDNIKLIRSPNIKRIIKTNNIKINKALNYINALLFNLFISVRHFDIIINYHYCQNWRFSLIKFTKAKLFAYYHDGVCYPECFSKKATKNIDRIFFILDDMKAYVDESFPYLKGRLYTTKNIIPVKKIRQASLVEDFTCDGFYNILTCARFTYDKGIDLALRACLLLKGRIKNFKWHFVGDGEEKDRLIKFVNDNDLAENVVFHGFKSNPYPYMRGCDLYVQPSRSESFGLTVAEALVLNKPVVSTKTKGAESIVTDNCAVLCDIDENSIAQSIYEIYKDEGKQLELIENSRNINFDKHNRACVDDIMSLLQ
ncbi:MAG: glycosyltransferase [Eubacterium sp.]